MSSEKLLQHRYSQRVFVFFVLLLLLSLSVPVVSAAGDEVISSYLSAEYIRSVIDNTPATNPALLDQIALKQNTVAVYGVIPALPQGEESYRLSLLLQEVVRIIHNDGSLVAYQWDNGGFIISYGSQKEYVIVSVHVDSHFTNEEINQVIQIIQDVGKEAGIPDLPIVVERDEHVRIEVPEAPSDPAPAIPGIGIGISVLIVLALSAVLVRKIEK
ncbi:MAG: hypothetical protein LBE57_05020 [Methanosarcinales archaeon]|jgi:hypothetical protein|nr:hypothetical protein [Methanosarcinales archaeon]